MRAAGKDISELFGYASNDVSGAARKASASKTCPFTSERCSKENHNQSEVYGTCSVTKGSSKVAGSEIIICPTRLYADNYAVFDDVINEAWPGQGRVRIAGGPLSSLAERARKQAKSVIAFGHNSGREFQITSYGKLSLDWILQSYNRKGNGELEAVDFVGMEVQSLDITGNYRDNWAHYTRTRAEGKNSQTTPPDSGHGLNWANVHKRLIPQLIRKGNVYAQTPNCRGFYFLVPDGVYKKFEDVIGTPTNQSGPSPANLSIITYVLGPAVPSGSIRSLVLKRRLHYTLDDVKHAFVNRTDPQAPKELADKLKRIL